MKETAIVLVIEIVVVGPVTHSVQETVEKDCWKGRDHMVGNHIVYNTNHITRVRDSVRRDAFRCSSLHHYRLFSFNGS